MSSKKYDDFDDLFQLQNQIHRLIHEPPERRRYPSISWTPLADIIETGDRFIILVELPGVEQSELEITLEGHDLKIRGRKKTAAEDNPGNFHRLEREFGEFRREFRFEAPVDRDRIEAVLQQGVLTVTIPKKRSHHAVTITAE